MGSRKRNLINSPDKFSFGQATAFALGAIIVAVVVVVAILASTPPTGFEAEGGTLTTPAKITTDSTASGGSALKFSAAATSSEFVHPGILVGSTQLSFVRAKIAAGEEPWKTFYAKLQTSSTSLGSEPNTPFTSLNYVPHPIPHMTCLAAPASGQPASCVDEKNDAIAAYADALMWSYSSAPNRDAYAQKSIEIMNAWSGTLIDHVYNNDTATYNALLQSAWAGSIFPRAAEIIRYTYTPPAGEQTLDIARFSNMLTTAYLPRVNYIKPSGGANGLMASIEASMNISIFTGNKQEFTNAISRWRTQVPAAIYATTDTNAGYPNLVGKGYPVPPLGVSWATPTVSTNTINSYWYQPARYPAGLEGETCRDPAHMSAGIGPMINAAETARLQGIDLYGEEKSRIVTALELNTGFINEALATGTTTPAGWPCQPEMSSPVTNASWKTTFEIAYNEFANRLHIPLPNTSQLLSTYSRPSSYKADFGMDFEGLTSYGTP